MIHKKTKKNRQGGAKPRSKLPELNVYNIYKYISYPSVENTKEIIEPYVVAIPTYKRPELIARATLWVLFSANIPGLRVSIFLANINERQQYIKILQDPIASTSRLEAILPKYISPKQISRYAKWLLGINIVVGHKGLAKQRNFIRKWYPSGQAILSMDDDVHKVKRLKVSASSPNDRSKWKLVNVIAGLDELIQSAFRKTRDVGGYLWGVYPVDNAYFMSPNSSAELKFIVGPMFGIINRPELAQQLDVTMDEKEDMERTLRHWQQDGVIVRLNYVTIQTAYFNNIGGMQASLATPLEYRKKEAQIAATQLHNMFPHLTRIYNRTGGPRKGWTEIRLTGNKPAKRTQKQPSSYVAYNSASTRYSDKGNLDGNVFHANNINKHKKHKKI